jgi:ketosteroid isomerase-like protein
MSLHRLFKPAVSAKLLMSFLAAACFAGAAMADEYSNVSRLIRGNQLAEAITQADRFLATKPRDAQMRFLKGVALSEQGKTSDAIALFTKLSEDFPELPEPYNNLAVLYAGQGQFEKARAALEMAIRTHPSYSTAHENLGDVYAKLASHAYGKALQLDAANSTAPGKLKLINDVFSAKPSSAQTKLGTVPAVATAATKAPAVAPAATVATVATAAVPAPVAAKQPAATSPAPSAATPAPAAAPVKPAVAPDDERAVMAAVESWAGAWSAKNMGGYFAAYAPDFKPTGGASRSNWELERRARIEGKSSIKVSVLDPKVTLSGDTATVKFQQRYDSDKLDVTSRKTLVLTRGAAGKWLIKQESSS